MKSIVILISGRGSNLEALLHAGLPLDIKGVISNRPDAKGLLIASQHGIATHVVDHKQYAERPAFDAALAGVIDAMAPDYIVLAGFMRVLTDAFVNHYPHRIVNIHPSLLPAFPGVDTHARAIAAGVKLHGCTVHLVTPTLDHGPIIIQAAVAVHPDDTPGALAARVLVQEHRIFPQALRWLAEDKVEILAGDVVRIRGGGVEDHMLISPPLQ